ncbi:MAG: hypothetical protein GY832_20720 [Chloroflexi bacterium]|nr:hypothetical protein [Chloroflexota bacterium]
MGLYLLALAVRLVLAAFIHRPGYMDVAYYAAGAVRFAQGDGFSEPFLWNYLDDPVALPRPAFLYWMPLPSLLAAPFAFLFPGSFFALQLPFVFISALFSVVAYSVAWEITGQRRAAWLVGLFTLFSGFFSPYWTLPETFAPFALFGSLALWLAGSGMGTARDKKWVGGFLAGLLVGLAHLTRADGILLLPIIVLASLVSFHSRNTRYATRNMYRVSPDALYHLLFVILGYLLIIGPWFIRNVFIIGAPLSSASTKTLWLRAYDDLVCYDCDLSLGSYLAWGWGNILSSKIYALWINFQHFMAEDCQVFLLPFVIIGLYRLRWRPPFALSLIYLFLLYLAHSLAFTFPGWRGSFFHSSGVLLPFLYIAALEGLTASVGWVARRRKSWNPRQARTIFETAMIVAAVALSINTAVGTLSAWWNADAIYGQIGTWMDANDASSEIIVMLNNPPGFYYHTGISSVVVPNGNVETLLTVADRYSVDYVVLDLNRPSGLAELYSGDEHHPRLRSVMVWDGDMSHVVLYAVEH